jgi:hypothetical protein
MRIKLVPLAVWRYSIDRADGDAAEPGSARRQGR